MDSFVDLVVNLVEDLVEDSFVDLPMGIDHLIFGLN